MNEHAKHWIDVAAISGAFATFVGWLPAIAAVLSIIWTAIRIYETRTFKRLMALLRGDD